MGYSKAETEKKQRKLVSKTQRNTRKVLVILFKIILVGIIAVIIAGAGAGFGMMKGILDNAPDTSSINIVPQGYRSNIRSQDGSVEKEISTIDSNRVYVYYDQIPKDMVNAFVAIEDQRFWTHNGIDVRGIFRAFAKGAASGHFNEGASTLTQQLIKNQVFNVGLDETTFMDKLERKIQEQYLAIELEKQYTKEEIVEYYLNTIYLGRGVSGVQAASEKYFGKDMTELTISEIAVIAGIPQNPSRYDPVANPDENKKRHAEKLEDIYLKIWRRIIIRNMQDGQQGRVGHLAIRLLLVWCLTRIADFIMKRRHRLYWMTRPINLKKEDRKFGCINWWIRGLFWKILLRNWKFYMERVPIQNRYKKDV